MSVTDGDKGDVTVCGGGGVSEIEASGVVEMPITGDTANAWERGRRRLVSGATASSGVWDQPGRAWPPASTTSRGTYRADGTWAAPAGGGGGSADQVQITRPDGAATGT